jgi:hypothetical protein
LLNRSSAERERQRGTNVSVAHAFIDFVDKSTRNEQLNGCIFVDDVRVYCNERQTIHHGQFFKNQKER